MMSGDFTFSIRQTYIERATPVFYIFPLASYSYAWLVAFRWLSCFLIYLANEI